MWRWAQPGDACVTAVPGSWLPELSSASSFPPVSALSLFLRNLGPPHSACSALMTLICHGLSSGLLTPSPSSYPSLSCPCGLGRVLCKKAPSPLAICSRLGGACLGVSAAMGLCGVCPQVPSHEVRPRSPVTLTEFQTEASVSRR